MTADPPITLGAFTLESYLARGGMGEVWSGSHPSGLEVAVKVLKPKGTVKPSYARAFREEVRAVAALDHPNVIEVFDYGQVDASAHAASGGKLPEGAPYLVMRRAPTALGSMTEPLPWSRCHALLLELLDALAHAHARGLVHRDLKPGNILLTERGRAVLADFGLSCLPSAEPGVSMLASAGTPQFMPPEQITGSVRDFGPWTDLYALGSVAWWLTTGKPPYGSLRGAAVVFAKLRDAAPEFHPVVPVPPGFEGWLREMLAPDPAARIRRAADAAWQLSALPPAPDEVPDTRLPEQMPTLFATLAQTADMAWAHTPARAPDRSTRPARGRPPLPVRWSRPQRPVHRARPTGAGLGLWGLRRIPLVGRQHERDALWRALADVHRDGSTRCVAVSGGTGSGKTRLAEWLATRAHETGAATVLSATHGASPGPQDGVGPMIERHLRCTGLDRAAAEARLAELLPTASVPAVLELVCPATEPTPRAVRFASAAERHTAAYRLLADHSVGRPVLVVLDDAHRSADSLAFARLALASGTRERRSLLIVLTVSSETELDGIERIELEPLPHERRIELVRELLGLEPALAAQVETRTAGNPLFAIELVGDWVRRDLLVPGRAGFRLRPGASTHMPDDLFTVWVEALERLLAHRSEDDARALEVAAALGSDVDGPEWRAVCAHASVHAEPGLVDFLITERQARVRTPGADTWSFAHGMLREGLLRRARQAGRLRDHHRACAEVLEARGAAAERLGDHLFRAGAGEAAIGPLTEAARRRSNTGDYSRAKLYLKRRQKALSKAGVPVSDPRWGQGWVLEAHIDRMLGDTAHCDRLLAAAEAAARREGWHDLLGAVLIHQAVRARLEGDLDRARTYAAEARTVPTMGEDQPAREGIGLGHVYLTEAITAMVAQQLTRASELLEPAQAWFQRHGDALREADARRVRGFVAVQQERWDEADAWFVAGAQAFAAAGARLGVGMCTTGRGHVARGRRDFEAAAERYREGMEIYESIGARGQLEYSRIGLAGSAVGLGQYDEARALLKLCSNAEADIVRLECEAGAGAWDEAEALLRRVVNQLEERPILRSAESARLLDRVADRARRAGRVDLATACLDWVEALKLELE